jgi:hypothetical protein
MTRKSPRRKLRKAWEERGFEVEENGHGRVRDAEGRLVATYALTPGSQRSARTDWRKLDAPKPLGIDRETTGQAGQDATGLEVQHPERYRHIPREPRPGTVPGFMFPDFKLPQRSWTPEEQVRQAVERRKTARRQRVAAGRRCDRCNRDSGADTMIYKLKGSTAQREAWFRNLDPSLTTREVTRLARREDDTMQLCAGCAEDTGLPPSVTYGEVMAVSDPEATVPVYVLDLNGTSRPPLRQLSPDRAAPPTLRSLAFPVPNLPKPPKGQQA